MTGIFNLSRRLLCIIVNESPIYVPHCGFYIPQCGTDVVQCGRSVPQCRIENSAKFLYNYTRFREYIKITVVIYL